MTAHETKLSPRGGWLSVDRILGELHAKAKTAEDQHVILEIGDEKEQRHVIALALFALDDHVQYDDESYWSMKKQVDSLCTRKKNKWTCKVHDGKSSLTVKYDTSVDMFFTKRNGLPVVPVSYGCKARNRNDQDAAVMELNAYYNKFITEFEKEHFKQKLEEPRLPRPPPPPGVLGGPRPTAHQMAANAPE
tara:strand:+ start:7521 stop:8093 length:573 start_codon:yes stop_codon:yes gene_type:complete